MLKTVKKVSSHPTCNKNVLEKFIGPTVFGFNHQSSFCYLPGQSQFRSFFLLSNGCLFNSTNRVLATSDNYHVPIEKANEMNYFWEDYTKKISFKRRCVNKVATLLNCKEKIATALVDEHPVLFLEDINNTWENIQLLIESGISKDTIKKNIWVLYFDHGMYVFLELVHHDFSSVYIILVQFLDDLKSRISTIQQWNVEGCELKDFLPLLRLSPLDFQRSLDTFDVEKSTIPYGNRIVYLANILQVN
ncbi:hypothetical protein V9T40_011079 [Parthenolecanium corni]|uniref:Uncharacterized protein n=1 Tax=Parthenolecanium corni TaxID=536013 RepID=A0AAN9T8L2_9HEMI